MYHFHHSLPLSGPFRFQPSLSVPLNPRILRQPKGQILMFNFYSKTWPFAFSQPSFSFRVRIELALVGAERRAPATPGANLQQRGTRAARGRSHTRRPTVCISKFSNEPAGPETP